MKTKLQSEYRLSDRNIDAASEEVRRFLAAARVEHREALGITLTLEEALLSFQARVGNEAFFRLRCIKRFSSIKVEIIVPGEAFDPLGRDTDGDELIQRLLAAIGLAPVWSWKNGRNLLVFTPRKKPLSDTVKLLAAMGLALLAGLALCLLPENISAGINNYLLTPGTDAFMGLISAISGPLIFFSVLGSICSMGNLETFGRIGSRTIQILLFYMLVIGFLVTSIGCRFYPVEKGGFTGTSFSQVLDLIYDIVPSNLFESFVTGNVMQLIFIAVVTGIAMLSLSTRVSGVFRLVEQFAAIVQTIMAGISSLLPVLIFLLFTGMISGGNLGTILNSWKPLALALLLMGLYYTAAFLKVVFSQKLSPSLLFRKVWPTFLITLTTASSAASFYTNTQDASKKLGIHKQLTEFGIPLGQVLFMPDTFIVLFSIELFLARSCGIPITPPWLLMGFVTNLLLAFAVPPIPGGTMLGLTIAFTQLGIPMELMGIALAINAIADFPGSAVSVSGWQLALIDVADSLDMLDRETLHRREECR